ncbi:unnamed protein product [Aureobasidium uvarum]|uniref:C3H1-type domain-containing protein n=1 Tax=Aureobasidium uvarum TaxID=2773716 RepID=A0A9N8PRV8_9PEZI|nr:unnamed protein product [Aureobasidium uvarum]
MESSPAMWQRNNRPVCRMWQMGRCPLTSIQCDFRHADPQGSNALPVLAEGFVPQPRSSDLSWDFGSHAVHRDRRPLQEIVLPASSTSVREIGQESDQGTWGSPRSSPQRWAAANPAGDREAGTSGKSTFLISVEPIWGACVSTSNRSQHAPGSWLPSRRIQCLDG